MPLQALDQAGCTRLARAIPDLPETVLVTSQLRQGRARAWVVGTAGDFETAVVEDTNQPGELFLISVAAQAVLAVLPHLPAWECLSLSPALAPVVGAHLAAQGTPVRYWEHRVHTLNQPVASIRQPEVRLLTPADLSLLAAAPEALQGPQPRPTLLRMTAAGAVVDGRLVAVAQNFARSACYGEIGVHTLPGYRQVGYATAAAALVARQVQAVGLTPVWSCGRDNPASLRVAHKLGFAAVSHRTYLILQR